MPELLVIPKDGLEGFTAALMQRARVMAPVRAADGTCAFEWLTSAAQADLTCGNPMVSPKQAFLPRTEALFFYRKEGSREVVIPPAPAQPQVVLGIHACDARAVAVLDAVFSAEPAPDQLYMERRKKTTLVGRAFLKDEPLSFYRDLGIDPLAPDGCDLFLFPLQDGRMLLEVVTEKGRELEYAFNAFKAAGATEAEALAEARRESAARVAKDMRLEEIKTRLDKLFDSGFWDRLHGRCVGCGACTFLCPTCHCFEIREETKGNKGARVRLWDTCQFEVFTKHASGHNPRSSQKERTRQRLMHKFSYGPENHHIPFCVGCGRCIACCPAGNDLREVLKELQEMPLE